MKRWVAAVVLAVLSVIGMPALAAQAGPEECADTYFADSGRELFEPDPGLVPPPLRGTGWDCASHIANTDGSAELDYTLVWVDIPWSQFVSIVRAFEDSEWALPGLITAYDLAGDGAQPVDSDTDPPLAADELAALEPLEYAHARFSNDATRDDIIDITYADGIIYDNAPQFDVPTLAISVLVSGGGYDTTGVADPSVLSGLPTIYLPSGVQWTFIAGGSLMLMLVVGWPSTLLNSVVGSRYQSIVRWVTTRFRRKPVDADAPAASAGAPAPIRRSGLPGWLMWPGFALAAILGAFVDPDFGINLMSLRLIVTLFLSFVLFNLLAWTIVRRVAVRLQPDSDPYLRFRWGSLVLVILAVLVARLLGLEPGVIFGLVAGIAYATSLQAAKSAVVTIVGSAIGLGFALVAWIGYSLLLPVEWGDNVAGVFLVEFLAGVTVKGVSTLPLSLLPLGNLDGAKLFGWKKVAWGASYAVGLAAFMIVLLTIPKAWGEIPGDFVKWLILFGVYALVAIVVWAVNARMLAKKPLPPEAQQGDQPDAITID